MSEKDWLIIDDFGPWTPAHRRALDKYIRSVQMSPEEIKEFAKRPGVAHGSSFDYGDDGGPVVTTWLCGHGTMVITGHRKVKDKPRRNPFDEFRGGTQ